ncbi:uncharacterized protein LOC126553127 [Aphis gossypii]|uniref:uncharacterized protein LOC126553127 n=1 Tax=Aphis gossypii TaxID=80765 RepID=UPI0021596C4A|nr:uncharacterized protein LOC126553127 [Aphis gossypii]
MDEITTQLKKMLLSQNTVFQDKSIQFMIRSLKDPKQFNLVSRTYLDADMIQFLCEPLLSINTPLIQSICICIWMLSKNDTFYKRNDVLYTCNSLLRTLVFLIRTSDALVSDLIQLLAIIIKKGGTNLQEICNIPQVLTIIKMVFTNSQNLPAHCVINAISILTYFLSCPSIELSNKLYNTSMSISKAICKSVTGKCIIDPRVVDIASNLSSSLLRLYSTITKRVSLNENLKKHTETAKLFKNVAWYMIKHISLPFVQKNLNINIYYKSYRKAIKNLLSPFRESLSTPARQNISSHYAASRIIKKDKK